LFADPVLGAAAFRVRAFAFTSVGASGDASATLAVASSSAATAATFFRVFAAEGLAAEGLAAEGLAADAVVVRRRGVFLSVSPSARRDGSAVSLMTDGWDHAESALPDGFKMEKVGWTDAGGAGLRCVSTPAGR
jgi:hypothetical protein